MPTVLEKVVADATAGDHALSARRLFIVFCALARRNYRYTADGNQAADGATIVDQADDKILTTDCAGVARAFVDILARTNIDTGAEVVQVSHGQGFATAAGGRNFDLQITGNIRKPGGTWAEVARCAFAQHYFVRAGTEDRMLYDPCMFTTYATMDDVKSWTFTEGGGAFNSAVRFVDQDPNAVLLRLPGDYVGPKPHGFGSGLVIFKKDDFKKDEYSCLRGRRNKPAGWSDEKYAAKAPAAMARVNSLLNDRAGVNGSWKL